MIRRIQNGQKEYLDEIAAKYYDDIYYFCCYQTGNGEDAYDLTQETFCRFIRYVENYQYRNLKGYLLTIAMNLCRDYMRTTMSTRRVELSIEQVEHGDVSENRTMIERKEQGTSSENAILLAEALLELPDIQREAVLLHHFYGYKNREIARMTGVSYVAVKSRVRQGIQKLSQLLDQKDFL